MNMPIFKIYFLIPLLSLALSSCKKGNDELWERKTKAQIDFHNEFTDLLIKTKPELTDRANLLRNIQILMFKRRTEEYNHLLKNKSQRIIQNEGLSKWMNFDWDPKDEAQLLKVNETYKELTASLEAEKTKLQSLKSDSAAFEKFAEVRNLEEYKQIQKKLTESLNAIEAELSGL